MISDASLFCVRRSGAEVGSVAERGVVGVEPDTDASSARKAYADVVDDDDDCRDMCRLTVESAPLPGCGISCVSYDRKLGVIGDGDEKTLESLESLRDRGGGNVA